MKRSVLIFCLWGCQVDPKKKTEDISFSVEQKKMPNSDLTRKLNVNDYNPSLSNEQLLFIESAITGSEYVEQGFQSLKKWDISLKIIDEGERYYLTFFPETGKVNAEWTLYVDKGTGKVTPGMTATSEPEPDME